MEQIEIEKEGRKAAKALYAPGPDTPEAVATSERYYRAAKLAKPSQGRGAL